MQTAATAIRPARAKPESFTAPRPVASPARVSRSGRVGSIDVLRGLVMVIMTLDHVRAYLTSPAVEPTDLGEASTALFLTRWITHYCAPTFVLLAGMSAWLAGRRRTRRELSTFLLTRGIWLILLEVTVVSFGWYFNLRYEMGAFLQVIWAIGASMVVLAGLVHLPRPVIGLTAFALIAGHNLLDGFVPAPGSLLAALWPALHVEAAYEAVPLFVIYPIVPWIGVMAAGYFLGPLLVAPAPERRRQLVTLGLLAIGLFIVLRVSGVYGEPSPMDAQGSVVRTFLSFLNTTKYPPSLLYLCMTLGPGLIALALLERAEGRAARVIATFGQAPLFYYVAHIYLVHALALGLGTVQGFAPGQLATAYFLFPANYGAGLGLAYAVTVAVVMALYQPTRAFAERKRRGTGWWWSYV